MHFILHPFQQHLHKPQMLTQAKINAFNQQFKMYGIDEVMTLKLPSSSGASLIDCNIELPKIPKRFKHLYDNIEEKQSEYDIKYAPTGICDCNNVENSYLECPHLQDPSFVAIFQVLPKRLMHLDLINPKNKDKIKWNLFCQVVHAFEHLPCKKTYPDSQNFLLTDSKTQLVLHQQLDQPDHLHVHSECHILRDLKKMFPVEYERYYDETNISLQHLENTNNKAINMRQLLMGSFLIGLLFNAMLMYIMLTSNSKIITSLLVDIFSLTIMQLLQYLTYQLKSFKSDQFQYVLHNKKIEQYYSKHNYSSLASLVIGSINLSLSISTIGTIISSLIEKDYQSFNYKLIAIIVCGCLSAYMLIVGLLLQFLYIKYKTKQRTTSNFMVQKYYYLSVVSLIGILGYQFNEKGHKYVDPIISIAILFGSLCQYLVLIIQQMKSLVGKLINQSQMDEYMMMLLHEFTCTVFVQSVDSFVGYTSGGDKEILEINITVPQSIDIDGAHSIVQTIQSGFEKLKAIQRCHVHVESNDCINEFEIENASVKHLIKSPSSGIDKSSKTDLHEQLDHVENQED